MKEPLKSIQENSDQLQQIFDIHGITWEEQNNIKHKGNLIQFWFQNGQLILFNLS